MQNRITANPYAPSWLATVFCVLFCNTEWVTIYRFRISIEKFLNSKQKGLLVRSICNIHLVKFCVRQLP